MKTFLALTFAVLILSPNPANAQAYLTFSGGNGTPLTFTLTTPVTYTLNASSSSTPLIFNFQGVGNAQPNGGIHNTNVTLAFSIDGGPLQTINGAQSGYSGGSFSPNDLYIYDNLNNAPATSGEVVTLYSGSLTTPLTDTAIPLISYLDEHEDAKETAKWVEKAGRKAVLMPGDIGNEEHCQEIVKRALKEFDRLDILVNNAAYQRSYGDVTEIPSDEWDRTFRTNIYAIFYLVKAAVPHMPKGASIINTASIQADSPSPGLLAYAPTKGAIANFTGALASSLAKRGIRANSVAPGPIWTPLIPSTLPAEKAKNFGKQVPYGRPGQPVELAPPYVMLASEEASYISGAIIAVTGGESIL